MVPLSRAGMALFRSRRPPFSFGHCAPAKAGALCETISEFPTNAPAFAGPRWFPPWSGLRDLLLIEELLQLAGLEHLHHDVAAADELALHIELGNGRPVGIGLDAVPDLRILQHVHGLEGDAEMVEDRHRTAGEAALREER